MANRQQGIDMGGASAGSLDGVVPDMHTPTITPTERRSRYTGNEAPVTQWLAECSCGWSSGWWADGAAAAHAAADHRATAELDGGADR